MSSLQTLSTCDMNTENSHIKESKSLEKQVFHSSGNGNGNITVASRGHSRASRVHTGRYLECLNSHINVPSKYQQLLCVGSPRKSWIHTWKCTLVKSHTSVLFVTSGLQSTSVVLASVTMDRFFIPWPFPYPLLQQLPRLHQSLNIRSSVTSDFSEIPQQLIFLGYTSFGKIMQNSQRLQCIGVQRAHSWEGYEDCICNLIAFCTRRCCGDL
jgi:hypothetical protein